MTLRTTSVISIVGCTVLLTAAQASLALPSYGSGCQGCHMNALGTIAITGNDTTADPNEACSTPNLGTRPVFTVAQGATKTLSGTVSGIPSGASYAAVMKNFQQVGVGQCTAPTFAPDSTWLDRGGYYTLPKTGNWYTAPAVTSFPFSITVGASTPADYYDLVLAVAGLNGGTFYTEAHFYVQVTAAAPTGACCVGGTTCTTGVTQAACTAQNGVWQGANSTTCTNCTPPPPTGACCVGGTTCNTGVTEADCTAQNGVWQGADSTTCANCGARPTIVLSKTSLTPQTTRYHNPPSDTFTISNSGGGALNFTVRVGSSGQGGGDGGGSGGGSGSASAGQTLFSQMCAGCHSAASVAGDANHIITNMGSVDSAMNGIMLTAQQVTDLKAYLATLSSGSGGGTDDLTIARDDDSGSGGSGGGGSGVTWLTVSPTHGTTTGPARTITVRYYAASLPSGTYRATITVSDRNATNNPQTIAVTLTIGGSDGEHHDDMRAGSTSADQADPLAVAASMPACGVGAPLFGTGMFCALIAMKTTRGRRRRNW